MPVDNFKAQSVRSIPDKLEEGILYVSLDYRTAVHKCACGCGRNAITPLGPAQWKLTFDGSVTLHPSIGNWSFPCRSHYLIQRNAVVWADQWSDKQIAAVKVNDREAAELHYNPPKPTSVRAAKNSLWARAWNRLSRKG
jgi:hypothetical protein